MTNGAIFVEQKVGKDSEKVEGFLHLHDDTEHQKKTHVYQNPKLPQLKLKTFQRSDAMLESHATD